MKITKKYLQKLIKEEAGKVISEYLDPDAPDVLQARGGEGRGGGGAGFRAAPQMGQSQKEFGPDADAGPPQSDAVLLDYVRKALGQMLHNPGHPGWRRQPDMWSHLGDIADYIGRPSKPVQP